MDYACTFDSARPWTPRNRVHTAQSTFTPHGVGRPQESPQAEWLLFRFRITELLTRFPDAYEAFVNFLRKEGDTIDPGDLPRAA